MLSVTCSPDNQVLVTVLVEIEGLDELIAEVEGDPELRNMAYDDKREAVAKMAEAEKNITTLLQAKDSDDNKNVILEVRSGASGDESALFAMDLLRMYTRFSENKGWKLEPLSINETNDGGCSAAAVSIKGAGAFGRLKYESGVHRRNFGPRVGTRASQRLHHSWFCP